MDKRLHIYYSGAVQGVGFRFTAERIAIGLDVKGWVRNLPDGRVEVAAEAPEPALKDFLRKVDDVFKEYISDVDAQWSQANGEFETFDIRT